MMDYKEKLDSIVERARKDGQELVDRYRRESDERMARMERYAEELDKKSIENFAYWREYLHKYYVLVLAFIGGSGIFATLNDIENPWVNWGIYLALAGILVGFLAINIYFYLERRWFQISNYVGSYGLGDTHDHPDVVDDPVLASKLNISKKVNEFKEQLKIARKEKDKKQVRHLKNLIRGHNREKRLMKYLGQQFGMIEHFWVASVAVSFLLTSIGIVFIFVSILNN